MKRRALVIVGCSLRSSYIPLYARKRGVVTVFVLPKGIDDKTQIIVNQDTYKLSVNFVKNAYDRKKEYNDDVDIFLESEKLSRFDLIDIIKKKYEVVAVTPGNDQLFQTNCIELADMFAKEFNVIGANDINTSILRSNKFYFNRHLDSCNLRSVPGFNVNSLAEYNALTSIKFPCIFKPSIGHGTINVFFAEDKNALDKIVNEYYKNEKHFTSVNIDEYIQGTEHEVNFVVVDGTILFINATTNVREVIGGVPLYRYAHSISDDDPVFASLVDYGKKVLKALNYK
jgi:glutathione synthase/RimK-type ligase-like ATP-grasp enzyme